MNARKKNPHAPNPHESTPHEPAARRSGRSTSNRNTRISPEARAEVVLLQSLALRMGHEAALQNGIETAPYLDLESDPRGATLSTLTGVDAETVTLRATLTLVVNARTGAVVGFTPPPRPRTR